MPGMEESSLLSENDYFTIIMNKKPPSNHVRTKVNIDFLTAFNVILIRVCIIISRPEMLVVLTQ